MKELVESPYLVPFDGTFRVADSPVRPPRGEPSKKDCKRLLARRVAELDELQRILYAHDRHAILLVFQAMDAAGKDSTIRAVLSGVDPAGCQVFSFQEPSKEELDHDFLWRTTCRLPERGRIGVFNRSYYEEVLVVRVERGLLARQRLPDAPDRQRIWAERFESIRDHEKHLARNGTVILKFFLNVSKEEQRRRFLRRLDRPEKNWKFSPSDVRVRESWDRYMRAYEQALNETSRPWAPWYAVPADSKPHLRLFVAEIVVRRLRSLGLRHPRLEAEDRKRFAAMRRSLERE